MSFSINILDWIALAPGLTIKEQWQAWSLNLPSVINNALPVPKCSHLPMMTARRLNSGSRLAVNCGLALFQIYPDIDAIVFSSRHGELERNYRILTDLAQQVATSPTNFAMSVHNAAVGTLAIVAKAEIPTSSVAAGRDSFQQGLYEVLSLLHSGYKYVLYVDFDGAIPDIYLPELPADTPNYPYACAYLITAEQRGEQWTCTRANNQGIDDPLPQSLQFLRGMLSDQTTITMTTEKNGWVWRKGATQ